MAKKSTTVGALQKSVKTLIANGKKLFAANKHLEADNANLKGEKAETEATLQQLLSDVNAANAEFDNQKGVVS